jgi:hypothetical protein
MKDSKFVIIWSEWPGNSELELLYATPLICQFIIDNIVVICVNITICNVGTVNSLLLLFEILGLNSFNTICYILNVGAALSASHTRHLKLAI